MKGQIRQFDSNMADFHRNRGNNYGPAGAFDQGAQLGVAEVQHLAAQGFRQNPPVPPKVNSHFQTGSAHASTQSREYTVTGNQSIPRAQASPRQDMHHLSDEIAQLRAELESKKEEIQAAYDAADSAVEELTAVQDELEETNQQMEEKARQLDERTRELGRKERELQAWRGNVERLSAELDERIQTEVSLNQRLSAVRLERAVTPQNDAELQALQAEASKAKADLEETKGRLVSKEREFESAQVDLVDQRRRREQAEVKLLELRAKQLDIAQQSEAQRLVEANAREEIAKAQAEAAEVKRLVDFFKTNSEKMSRQNRELNSTQRLLQESLQGKDRELQELTNEISALRFQMGDQQRR